jgi:phospholipase/carboxylesterase
MTALDNFSFETRASAGDPEGLLVLFHGRGADEHDLQPFFDVLDPERRLLGITPRGPLSLPPGGAHWYVVPRVGYPDPETFRSTLKAGTEWLTAIAEETGIPPRQTVLGGFSQGSVMSYAWALTAGQPRPAGVLALSGFIPTVPDWQPDLAPPLPRFAIGHGTHDSVIPVDFGRTARAQLEHAGADVTYGEYPLPHAVDPTFLHSLRDWLRDTFEQPELRGWDSNPQPIG